MALSRRIARPLLASIFIAGGLEAVQNPAGKVKKAETVTKPLSEIVGAMPSDPETLVRINGAVQISAGLLLATGKLRRLASLALIGSIIPTTYAGHRFWEETDEVARAQQRIHFLKNLGLLGGLILAAVDTEGDPSLGWRTKRRAHQLEAALAMGRAASNADLRGAAGKAQKKASHASKVGKHVIRRGNATTRRAVRSANKAGFNSAKTAAAAGAVAAQLLDSTGREGLRHVGGVVSDAARESGAKAAQQALSAVGNAARQLEPLAQGAIHSGLDIVGPYLASGSERTAEFLTNLSDAMPAT
jgi:uncharacterized membrane protein YphA (DoxX/SURF4 family)